MNGPASLAVAMLNCSKDCGGRISPQRGISEFSFDMRLHDDALTSGMEEPFPIISWVSDNRIAAVEHSVDFQQPPSPKPCKQLFFMSSQARRLKRRRRGCCAGYLVRCSEVFESLLHISDGSTLENAGNGDEYDHHLVTDNEEVDYLLSNKTKKVEGTPIKFRLAGLFPYHCRSSSVEG
jgi:hypothetical protein